MPRHGTPGGVLSSPWDRNAAPVIESQNTTLSENDGLVLQWSYTVPSGRHALIASLQLGLLALVAGTTTTGTDRAEAHIEIVPSGGSQEEILTNFLASAAMAAGERLHVVSNPGTPMMAGDQLRGETFFNGDNGGAGRVRVAQHVWALEYNAG